MSRIVVKNLPKTATEEKVRRHFEGVHEITDINLKHDPTTGKFRGFAFIGFRDYSAAKEIVQEHDRTFFERNRILVETYDPDAVPVKERLQRAEEDKRRTWEEKQNRKKRKLPDPLEEFKDDPDFKEFLNVQRNIGPAAEAIVFNKNVAEKKYIWTDDTVKNVEMDDADSGLDDPIRDSKESKAKQPSKPPTSFGYTVKISNLPYKVKKSSLKPFFAPIPVCRVKLPAKIKGICYVSFKNKDDLEKALRKHKSVLEGKQVDVHVYKGSETAVKFGEGSAQPNTPAKKPYHEIKESVADSGRLFIRNLPYTCKSEDLEDLFKGYGKLSEVYLPIDDKTKKLKGFAFVSFMFPEHAARAMDELDKTVFQGRLLHILPGESKPENLKFHFNQLSSFQKQKEMESIQTKKKASTWNTLFLSADAVAEVLSSRFNVKKSDLIADSNAKDSIAVRMALGETQIVNETKKFLEDNGINLDAFGEEETTESKRKTRSKTVILVKNLPIGIEGALIRSLFSRYGSVTKVILPLHGVTAIVEFQEEVEAKKAFDGLINYKLNHVPIYLEWAPLDVFDRQGVNQSKSHPSPSKAGSSKESLKGSEADKTTSAEHQKDQEKPDESSEAKAEKETEEDAEGFCLFVKNVSFDTTDASFEQHFACMGKLISAKVSRKKGSNLSNGYGFVIYKTKKSAEKALRQLQNSKLDGHLLQVDKSAKQPQKQVNEGIPSTLLKKIEPIKREEVKPESNDNREVTSTKTTKILVRNVPFEANAKEVSQVFSAFGGVKSVRMPKKMVSASNAGHASSQRHRGFAFVEFVTRSQAEKAFKSLSGSTHLYGRRLVLEWAKQDDMTDHTFKDDDEDDVYPHQKTFSGNKGKRLKKSDLVTRLQFSQDKKRGFTDDDNLR